MPTKPSSESPEYSPTPARSFKALTTRIIGYRCPVCKFTRGAARGHKECPLTAFCPNCIHETLVNAEIPRLEVIEEVVPVSKTPLEKTTRRASTDDVETVIMPRSSAKLNRKKK